MSTVVAKNLTIQNSAGTASTNISFDGTKLVSTALDNSIVATANLHDLGVGQTWQAAETNNTGAVFTDGTSKYRAAGVTYTNTTGKPIVVHAVPSATSNGVHPNTSIIVSGLTVASAVGGVINHSYDGGATAIVPVGATYRIAIANSVLAYCIELR